ncbi:MAG: thermonuclease family protein [Acidobacteria bacterium]|nr:thermonuclease family protein [Acidobacteriota bacterium]
MRPTLSQGFVLLMLLLTGASLYFTAGVLSFKRSLQGRPTAASVKSGQQGEVQRVIDGDELSVLVGTEPIRVRLLGVSAPDATMNDPDMQPAGRQTLLFLENRVQGRKVELVFDEFKLDPRKRLLCYVHIEGKDLGEDLVERGLALSYTKYPFSRLGAYALAEDGARRARRGIWSDPKLVLRAEQLKALWDAQRRKGDE